MPSTLRENEIDPIEPSWRTGRSSRERFGTAYLKEPPKNAPKLPQMQRPSQVYDKDAYMQGVMDDDQNARALAGHSSGTNGAARGASGPSGRAHLAAAENLSHGTHSKDDHMKNLMDDDQYARALAKKNASTAEELEDEENTFADDDLYDTSDQHPQKKRRLNKRQKAAIAGGITGILGGGIGFNVFAAIQGPMQFVHLAGMMEDFHLSKQNSQTSNRMLHIAKYVRWKLKGKPERARLTYLQNKFADKIENRFKESGYKFEYDKRGNFTRISLDPEKILGGGTKDMTPEQIQGNLEGTLGTPIGNDKDGFHIKASDLGFKKAYGVTYQIARTSGYGKAVGGLVTRLIGKLAKFNWHIMNKTSEGGDNDNKGSPTERDKKYADEQKQYVSDGAEFSTRAQSTGEKQGDVENAGKEGADAINDVVGTDRQSVAKNVGNKLNCVSVTSAVGYIATANCLISIACLFVSIVNSFFKLRNLLVIAPMMRMAFYYISMGDQFKANDKDISLNQAKYADSRLNDPKGTTWVMAASIAAHSGGGYNPRNDLPPSMNPSGKDNMFARTLTSLGIDKAAEALDPVCKAVTSPLGQAITLVINLALAYASGGGVLLVENAIKTGVAALFQTWGKPLIIKWVTDWLVGIVVDPNSKGAVLGSIIDYGTRFTANNMAILSGGTKLSKAKTAELDTMETIAQNREFSQKSFASRMFDTQDYRSTISRVMDSQNTNPEGELRNIASGFLNLGRTVASMPLRMASGISGAATLIDTPYQYSTPDFAFSADDLDNPAVDNPFANAEHMGEVLANNTAYIGRAKTCFNRTITVADDGIINITASDGLPDYHSIDPSSIGDGDTDDPNHCNDDSLDWLGVRMLIKDTDTMNGMACFEGADPSDPKLSSNQKELAAESMKACSDIGYDTQQAAASATATPTVSGDCKTLAQQLLDNKNVTYASDDFKAALKQTAKDCTQAPGIPPGSCSIKSVQIDPILLAALVQMAQSWKMLINNMAAEHGCDAGQHPKGHAVDINLISKGGQTVGPQIRFAPGDGALITEFYNEFANVLPSGVGGFGQEQCQGLAPDKKPDKVYFDDACTHIHIDTRNNGASAT